MLDFARRTSLETFEKELNYKFSNIMLLNEALTHSSYSNEHKLDYNYNRFEILGDALIGFIVIDFLFNVCPDSNEGEITKIKSVVVSTETLASVALKLGISNYMLLGHGEEQQGGRTKVSILADMFEAITASIYLDCKQIEPVYEFVIHNLFPEISKYIYQSQNNNYKALLQEYVSHHFKIQQPTYMLIKTLGPDHDKTFISAVLINNVKIGVGIGKTRKQSEQHAAMDAYNVIKNLSNKDKISKSDIFNLGK